MAALVLAMFASLMANAADKTTIKHRQQQAEQEEKLKEDFMREMKMKKKKFLDKTAKIKPPRGAEIIRAPKSPSIDARQNLPTVSREKQAEISEQARRRKPLPAATPPDFAITHPANSHDTVLIPDGEGFRIKGVGTPESRVWISIGWLWRKPTNPLDSELLSAHYGPWIKTVATDNSWEAMLPLGGINTPDAFDMRAFLTVIQTAPDGQKTTLEKQYDVEE